MVFTTPSSQSPMHPSKAGQEKIQNEDLSTEPSSAKLYLRLHPLVM